MKALRRKLWSRIQRYADAQEADSWKGGGDPDKYAEIEAKLESAKQSLNAFIAELEKELSQ